MCVELQRTRYREPGIFGLREMSKFKVAAVEISEEALRLQVVGSVALDRTAILKQGEFR